MDNVVDTVKHKIQNAIDSLITTKIELAVGLIYASFGRDATSVTANTERGEYEGIFVSFENVFERNDTLQVFNVNDENQTNIPEDVSELSVSVTLSDRQPHIHHSASLFLQKRNPYCQSEQSLFEFSYWTVSKKLLEKKKMIFLQKCPNISLIFKFIQGKSQFTGVEIGSKSVQSCTFP